ncbi:methyltransferase [Wohlfahrtiimonas larvae]|uniref:Methyltransferase n=1 Tax=Wohlfahrtiimonas larvae TaxID=1157986 RepID=A0ABP9MCD6_9GAMM|nr:methyltransferase [Wohlfahrtiimonas larvae]
MSEAFSALSNVAQKYSDLKSLWFVDENYDVSDHPILITSTESITNRIEIADYLKQYNIVNLSDYDCTQYHDESFDIVYLRVPKAKALLNHWIREAMRILKSKGRLICVGFNDEGIKNTFKKIEKAFGELVEQELLGKGLRIAEFSLINPQIDQIEDRDYTVVKSIENELSLNLSSKAGIYGADKIDQGSLFLCETVCQHYDHQTFEKVLDMGCGNGLISLLLAKTFVSSEFIATDNNITATTLCEFNFTQNNVNGVVILDDCARTIESQKFNLIVSNPPFHQGFETSENLTIRFLAATERLLAKKGEAWFVMNRFLKIESLAKKTSLQMDLMNENSQFKVLRFRK